MRANMTCPNIILFTSSTESGIREGGEVIDLD